MTDEKKEKKVEKFLKKAKEEMMNMRYGKVVIYVEDGHAYRLESSVSITQEGLDEALKT